MSRNRRRLQGKEVDVPVNSRLQALLRLVTASMSFNAYVQWRRPRLCERRRGADGGRYVSAAQRADATRRRAPTRRAPASRTAVHSTKNVHAHHSYAERCRARGPWEARAGQSQGRPQGAPRCEPVIASAAILFAQSRCNQCSPNLRNSELAHNVGFSLQVPRLAPRIALE